jgi:HAD superfamily hydrolase (TIGR01509 family)
MFKGIEAVIFDLDGTLISVEERFYRVFLDTLKAHNLPPVKRELFLEKFSMNQLGDFLRQVNEHAFWINFLKTYSSAHKEFSRALPGAREALEALKKNGIKIGVITGRLCEPDEAFEELQRLGLDNLVDKVVTKKLVIAKLKPEELFSRSLEIIQALEGLGADPKKSLVVADYVVDIRSAKNLGMRAVAVLSGSSRYEDLKKTAPDAIIKSIVELPALFDL